MDAFYARDGDRFVATPHTRGPWSNDHQHGGPPTALLARALERLAGPMAIVRLTVEILRPVPIDALSIETRSLTVSKRVARYAATLAHEGKPLMEATALCVRKKRLSFDPPARRAPEPALPAPDASEPTMFPFFSAPVGYHTSMELRIGRGGIGEGHAAAWLRMRHPLVDGEATSPLGRLAIAADSGNGVSAAIDHHRYLFINPDLTVYVHRLPEGEWIGLDARTIVGDEGAGLADDRLHDLRGPVARAVQSLLLDEL